MRRMPQFVIWGVIWILVFGATSEAVAAQHETPGTIQIVVMDCRHGDPADLSTCPGAAGVPFFVSCSSCDSALSELVRTESDGTFTKKYPAGLFLKIQYETEIVWTDQPVSVLAPIQFADTTSGSEETLLFVLLDPSDASEGAANLTVAPADCSMGDPNDLSTCQPIPGFQFLITTRDSGGVFTNDDFTSSNGTSVYTQLFAPVLVTISFDLDYAGFDLVSAHPTKTIVLLDGDISELDFVFVTQAQLDGPVTQLPDTGSGECAIRQC
jgi:hypothetical protein